MKERPIIFSAPMVRAILEGRKTQTRRVMKEPWYIFNWAPLYRCGVDGLEFKKDKPWPYGQPGDRLWVRETLRCRDSGEWEYGADHQLIQIAHDDERVLAMVAWAHHKKGDTCVSIHMPRWASRITLELTGVRVERLQEITGKDIIAEGAVLRAHDDQFGHHPVSAFDGCVYMDLKSLWARGWDKINAKRAPWASNPWVWVIQFKRAVPQ